MLDGRLVGAGEHHLDVDGVAVATGMELEEDEIAESDDGQGAAADLKLLGPVERLGLPR